jgi:E3 ubiquitin-protein ligase HUWE1
MHRMMQSTGTAEGLRGLIDTSLLKSIKKVIEYRGLFGPSVLHIGASSRALSCSPNLTCHLRKLSTLCRHSFTTNPLRSQLSKKPGCQRHSTRQSNQGWNLPSRCVPSHRSTFCFLSIFPQIIQAIPNAIGALCLNAQGEAQLAARPSIIPGIFSIFTSERHWKVLQDKENAVLIGTAIDELIRHHPALKTAVFDSLLSTLSKIEDLGNVYMVPDTIQHWYGLAPVSGSTSTGDDDVTMRETEPEDGEIPATDGQGTDPARSGTSSEDQSSKPHDNMVVAYMDILGRVRILDVNPLNVSCLSRFSSSRVCFSTRNTAKISCPRRTGSPVLAGSRLCHAFHMTLPTAWPRTP